jgi:hypothetical protein
MLRMISGEQLPGKQLSGEQLSGEQLPVDSDADEKSQADL